eukprot:SAG11_NODE_7066_length_1199_cov_1.623636_1_plen_149_part_00
MDGRHCVAVVIMAHSDCAATELTAYCIKASNPSKSGARFRLPPTHPEPPSPPRLVPTPRPRPAPSRSVLHDARIALRRFGQRGEPVLHRPPEQHCRAANVPAGGEVRTSGSPTNADERRRALRRAERRVFDQQLMKRPPIAVVLLMGH